MSSMRIGAPRIPVIPDQPVRAEPKKNISTQPAAAPELPAARDVAKESYITSLVAHRQPPKMAMGSALSNGPTSVPAMFAAELEDLEKRSTDDVAGDLAMTYLTYETLAQKEGDGDLVAAFEEMGELMRGYEHLRMLKTGELG